MNTRSSTVPILLLAIIAVALLSLLVQSRLQLARIKSDIRFAQDVVWGIRADRDLALGGDLRTSAFYLQRLATPIETNQSFRSGLGPFMERERAEASARIIAALRAKTGKDLGDAPEPWVKWINSDTNAHTTARGQNERLNEPPL